MVNIRHIDFDALAQRLLAKDLEQVTKDADLWNELRHTKGTDDFANYVGLGRAMTELQRDKPEECALLYAAAICVIADYRRGK